MNKVWLSSLAVAMLAAAVLAIVRSVPPHSRISDLVYTHTGSGPTLDVTFPPGWRRLDDTESGSPTFYNPNLLPEAEELARTKREGIIWFIEGAPGPTPSETLATLQRLGDLPPGLTYTTTTFQRLPAVQSFSPGLYLGDPAQRVFQIEYAPPHSGEISIIMTYPGTDRDPRFDADFDSILTHARLRPVIGGSHADGSDSSSPLSSPYRAGSSR